MAEALAAAGARVIVTSRDRARAEGVAAALGGSALGLGLDVRDEASVRSAVELAYEQWGGLDVLVNNAGIGMRTVNPRFFGERRVSGRCQRADSAMSSRRSSPGRSSLRALSCRGYSPLAADAS
jgi:NAD(P)-dependent dehydrogenase (short-subunit alcohol dehydrogenase family)